MYIQGNQILETDGTSVRILGVSRPGLEYRMANLASMIPETMNWDLDTILSWGGNAVRLPLRDLAWLRDPEYRAKVDMWIRAIRDRNMIPILDLHTQQDHAGQDPFLLRSSSGEDALRFWIQVAERYQNDTSIFFELFNEPYDITPSIWWYGNQEYYGYRDTLREIRRRATNPCILGGLDWAYQWAFLKTRSDILTEMHTIPNLILATHPYGYRGRPSDSDNTRSMSIPTSLATVAGCEGQITVPTVSQEDFGWRESFGHLHEEEEFPMMATEFGLDRPETAVQGGWYMMELLDYMDRLNMSYVAWAWVQDRLDYPSLLDPDFQPTGRAADDGRACATTLNNFYPGPGQIVRQHMMSNSPHRRDLLLLLHQPSPSPTERISGGLLLLLVLTPLLVAGCGFLFCFMIKPPPPRDNDRTITASRPRILLSRGAHTKMAGMRIRSHHSFPTIIEIDESS